MRCNNYAEDINQLLSDHDKIMESIEQDSQLKINDIRAEILNKDGLEELMNRDSQLTLELQRLNHYSIISRLIKEFDNGSERHDLEGCYSSLKTIHNKISMIEFSQEGIGFKHSALSYIDTLHLKFVKLFQDIMKMFCLSEDNKFQFTREVLLNNGTKFEYLSTVEICKSYFFTDNSLDTDHWFIKSMHMENIREEVVKYLTNILNNYIKLLPFIQMLKVFLFNDDIQIEKNDTSLCFFRCEFKFIKKIESFKVLCDYFVAVIPLEISRLVFLNIRDSTINELSRLIKQNSEILFLSQSTARKELIIINKSLISLSSYEGLCHYNGNTIDKLLNDEHIYITLMFDKLVQDIILSFKNIFQDKNWKLLTKFELPVQETKNIENVDDTSQNQILEFIDDWEWKDENDDDWGNELEMEPKQNLNKCSKEKSIELEDKNEGINKDDDWNEIWGIEEINLNDDKTCVFLTQVPMKFQHILESFEIRCKELGTMKISNQYNYKLNVLQTAFFAMSMCKYEEWWQMYTDIRWIVQNSGTKLLQLHELVTRFINIHVNNMKKVINTMIVKQLSNFRDNEKLPDWNPTTEYLLPYIQKTMLPVLEKLNNDQISVSLINFIYTESIITHIFHWNIISERNSTNLSKWINIIHSNTELSGLNSIQAYRHAREKFLIIGQLLTAHLRDIMNMLYQGDFYLFSTDEIVQWIILLFADTNMRRECIDEVVRIRKDADS